MDFKWSNSMTEMQKEMAPIELEMQKKEIGKYIVTELKESGTRMFVHRMNSFVSAANKDGWWDTFCLSSNKCINTGFYICRIEKFRIDRNGFLNMLVSPLKFIGENIDEDDVIWYYFARTRLFSSKYILNKSFNCNIDNLYKHFQEDDTIIFDKLLNNDTSLEEINNLLLEKTDDEKLSEDINRNLKKYAEKYPLLAKKLPYSTSLGAPYRSDYDTLWYLRRKNNEYDSLNLGDETDFLKRVEYVLQYWIDVHAEQKRTKKLEKQAKKATTTKE